MVVPDWNNPIVVTRPGYSKKIVGVYLGKRFDRQNPFALIMLILLVGLSIVFVMLAETDFWYLGVASLVAAIGLFLLIPASKRRNLKGNA